MCDEIIPDVTDATIALEHLLAGDVLVLTNRPGGKSTWTLQHANLSCSEDAVKILRDRPRLFARLGQLAPKGDGLFPDDPRLAHLAQSWEWRK